MTRPSPTDHGRLTNERTALCPPQAATRSGGRAAPRRALRAFPNDCPPSASRRSVTEGHDSRIMRDSPHPPARAPSPDGKPHRFRWASAPGASSDRKVSAGRDHGRRQDSPHHAKATVAFLFRAGRKRMTADTSATGELSSRAMPRRPKLRLYSNTLRDRRHGERRAANADSRGPQAHLQRHSIVVFTNR